MPNTDARARLVECARAWIGTPYAHQQRLRGVAVDCVGLVIGAGLEARVLATWSEEAWSEHRAYGRWPNPRHMSRAIARFLRPSEGAEPGNVAFMGWRGDLPMHLAIIGRAPDGRLTMIHAHSNSGRVVEHGFDAEWPGRVVSWWSYPGFPDN